MIKLTSLEWTSSDVAHIVKYGEIGKPVIYDTTLSTMIAVKARADSELQSSTDQVTSVGIDCKFNPGLVLNRRTAVQIPSKGINETELRMSKITHRISCSGIGTSFELNRTAEFPDIVHEIAKIKEAEATITVAGSVEAAPGTTTFPIIDPATGAKIDVDATAIMNLRSKTFVFRRI